MAEKKEGRILLNEEETRAKLLEGAKATKDPVATSYGPKGKNFLLEKSFGRPILTRDGVTIARDVFFSDRAKNAGSQILLEAAETTNRIAGDGTSATTVLSYYLLKNGIKAINSGVHPMEVKDIITQDSYKMLDKLEELAIPVKDEQLKEVATVSSGDPLLGELIADAIHHVGRDGGILTEKSPINEVEREYIDGYYLQSGFTALQAGKKEIEEPSVVVTSKTLSSADQANQLIVTVMNVMGITKESMQQTGVRPRILFIGNIEEAAYMFIVNLINSGVIDAIILKTPPQYGNISKELLEDIAIYAGCEPITDTTNMRELTQQVAPDKHISPFIGTVKKVVANKSESTLFADNQTELVTERVNSLKEQIETEVVDGVSEKLKDRVAKLEGKIALFKIGGATDTEREEKEFRVEDAINSTRNAYNEGIVAGGGVTLLELSKLDVSDIYKKSLQSTFKQLLINANLPAEVKLDEALKSQGKGYNLRESDKLVDVVKAGVIDPVVVTREVIKNATSAIGGAITIGGSLIFEDKEE